MKRSFINAQLRSALSFFEAMHFAMPPFARYRLSDWNLHRSPEIFDLQLGWDITSFGSGDFFHTGLLLFTLRNGRLHSTRYPKPYAEKIMIVRESQLTPRHFHWNKREDIINRGGGNLVIELFHADPETNSLTGKEFDISVNSAAHRLSSGDRLTLRPGDSVCFEPCHAHRFYGEPGSGTVLVGEVSMVNDDRNDNCFIDGAPRFDPIEEDEPIDLPLASDYSRLFPEKCHA